MAGYLTALPGFIEEQEVLPGLEGMQPRQLPLVAEVRPLSSEAPLPGQLRLDDRQMHLDELVPDPVQLALLDDPPPWDMPEAPPPKPHRGRLARRRRRAGITPGQGTLF